MPFTAADRPYLIALNRVPRVGAAKVASIKRAFGSLAGAVGATAEELALACKDLGAPTAQAVFEALHADFVEREEAFAREHGVVILTPEDARWPKAFRALVTPPLCLYCAGNLDLLNAPAVAMIGTRRASVYGSEQARRFALRLAEAGVQVVSGLAEGIDSASHEGALTASPEAEGKTVAFIGAALDCVYPSSRKPLAREIVRRSGLVVSEYAFGRHADKKTFPQRNRLVAGLAERVMVVETPVRGGTMITVDFAKRMGKPIYALPGRVDWQGFAGNHELLRKGEAKLVTSPEEILDDLDDLAPDVTRASAPVAPSVAGLSPEEQKLYNAVGEEEVTLDVLAQRTGLPMPQVMALAIGLQMRRRLRSLPGGRITRATR